MRNLSLAVVLVCLPSFLFAAEPAKPAAKGAKTPAERIAELEKTLTGSKFVGRFTVSGKDDKPPAEEEYTITSAKKLDEGDLWLLQARVKYGKTDKTLPIPLEIKWSEDTPIITMTDLSIPGLGAFSCRVVIYDGLYAGTWRHGEVFGHMYGRIGKAE